MVQAALVDGQFLDLFSSFNDGCVAPKVGVGGCDVAEALVIAADDLQITILPGDWNESRNWRTKSLASSPRNQIKARNINVLRAFIWLGVVNDLGSLRRRDELGANLNVVLLGVFSLPPPACGLGPPDAAPVPFSYSQSSKAKHDDGFKCGLVTLVLVTKFALLLTKPVAHAYLFNRGVN